MNRRRNVARLVLIGIQVFGTLVPLGCNSRLRCERHVVTSRDSKERKDNTLYASDDPTIQWLMRLPDAEPPPGRAR
jgi:hypothetical protein